MNGPRARAALLLTASLAAVPARAQDTAAPSTGPSTADGAAKRLPGSEGTSGDATPPTGDSASEGAGADAGIPSDASESGPAGEAVGGATADPDAAAGVGTGGDVGAGDESAGAVAAPAPFRPYSIAWNLRPLPSVNVIRFDQSLGLHDVYGPASSGLDGSLVQLITLGLRCNDWLMLVARWGWAWRGADGDVSGSTILLGLNLAFRLDPTIRLNFFVGHTTPTGGTNAQASNRDARLARASMDNAMFLPNHLAVVTGVAMAWIDQGWTIHGEATLFTLGRVTPSPDEAMVNATFGLHVGYFFLPELGVSGELHHQHFLSTPAAFASDGYHEDLRSQSSGTLGVRAHWHVHGSLWARPGLAYTLGFDNPMIGDAWQVVQLDVPVLF